MARRKLIAGNWKMNGIRATLAEARAKAEKHLKNGYFRQVQAPVGVGPALIAWMELN